MLESGLVDRLREWAELRNAAAALWLFGSRAKGTARPDSDHEFAVELRPSNGHHDWALGEYVALHKEWKAELRAIVGGEVSLVAFRDDIESPFDPREDGYLIWERTKPIAEVK